MKTPTITFNENVEYFPSRPPSVFYIDADYSASQRRKNSKEQMEPGFRTYEPDLVRGLSDLEDKVVQRSPSEISNLSVSKFNGYRGTTALPRGTAFDEDDDDEDNDGVAYVTEWPNDDDEDDYEGKMTSMIVRESVDQS